ncbi:MAG: alpha-2-macroglobulin [Saprospiraceae bacterium]|nr:alpha-2-macroglobulin [Saprospiraceae bacterium]
MKNKILIALLLIIAVSFAGTRLYNPKEIKTETKAELKVNTKTPYKELWFTVDSLINIGQPKTALEAVIVIYEKAKTENNSPEFIKSVLYKMRLKAAYEESHFVKSIAELENEIKATKGSQKAILQSILAETYWNYYNQNSWKIHQRSETINFDKKDIETWTIKDLVNATVKNYNSSLKNAVELQKISLKDFDLIINSQQNSKKYRPTLYDLLAHRAIDFFTNTVPGITRPADKFDINSEDYFLPWQDFVKIKIDSKDTMSLEYYAIRILKDLMKFHAEQNDVAPLVDVDLKRLQFVKSKSSIEIKDSLYLKALLSLYEKHKGYSISTDVIFKIAEEYKQRGAKYNRLQSDKNRWDYKTAKEYCELAMKNFPESDGANNCGILLNQIIIRQIGFTTEYVNAPQKPFRASVSYRNISDVYFRIIKIEAENDRDLTNKYSGKNLIDKYVKYEPLKAWSIKVENDGDFQQHVVEIKMPELSLGYYVVLASTNPEFEYANDYVAYNSFWISNISYIDKKNKDNSYDFYVLDRQSGDGMKNVKISSHIRKYDYNKRIYEYILSKNYLSDSEGHFNIPAFYTGDSKYFYLDFKDGNDRFITQNYFSQYRYYKAEIHTSTRTHFFTDRAIYRPGQTVHFKGIVLQSSGEKTEIKTNFKTTVYFRDYNNQEIGKQVLTTNEYGTFSGTFTTPSSGLTGYMTIRNENGAVSISVEEYKRPKFEVTYEPIKGSYKLGEKLIVKGKAKAYAGNNIDGAKVKYRVVRTARFPYWGYWWRGYAPSSPSLEIKNGEMETDENGEFDIEFTALADKSIAKNYKPVFNYEVIADVTDINGETHSATKYVSVGYTALILNVNLPEKLDKTKKHDIEIKTTNLNGEFEPAKGDVFIYRLEQPIRTFRNRMWAQADKFSMTQEEYYKAFPNDIYKDEDNKYNWKKSAKVFSFQFDTEKSKELNISEILGLKAGHYVLEISAKDKYGELIANKSYFCMYSPEAKQIPDYSVDWFLPLKSNGEPGEKIMFNIGTKEKGVKVLYEIESKQETVHHEWINLSDEQKLISIPIKEEYRGNFVYHLVFIKNGRKYYHKQVVTVPYTNKELDIEFETFRDKLQPGQQEEWKIKIKGKKGEKVAAEMMAAMYDASLDAFKANNWTFNLYNSYYSMLNWGSDGFTTSSGRVHTNIRYSGQYFKYKSYDQLNWFGFNPYGYYTYGWGGDAGGTFAIEMEEDEVMMAPAREATMAKAPAGRKDKSETVILNLVDNDQQVGDVEKNLPPPTDEPEKPTDFSDVKMRSNFNETAFFYPQLQTDENGDVVIKFTVPESLTKWKIMGFAHTKDLMYGQIRKELVTQKDLMIMPNAPRFFRENDKITFTAKISNISDGDLEGEAKLMLFDATTMKPIDELAKNKNLVVAFSAKKGQSAAVSWDLSIPEGIGAITYKIAAKAGNFTDGEEMAIPVLSNRMMVTESLPLPVKGNQTKNYTFEKLVNSASSTTLKNYKLTLEYTSNPAWYAIQALPYLMEYPYECSEQTFSRYYANSIASHIVNSSPKIKAVFDSWKNLTPDALLSNLEKNQELKAVLLEETPWLLQGKDESARKRRVALLFDLNKMSNELDRAIVKLQKAQSSNGGWPWFKGGEESRYITQHIVTGMGHLDHLGVTDVKKNPKVWNMVNNAILYLDERLREDYEYMLKHYPQNKDKQNIGSTQIQYLYARSYFKDDVKLQKRNQEAFDYYFEQGKKYWLSQSKYMQGMLALGLHRYGEKEIPALIIKSLKEHSLSSEEMGMYWRNDQGWYWYQAPIETQALMIEAFDEVANDKESVEEMKVWLLKQKQTTDWKTTKATVEACYALLLRGTDLLASDKLVEVKLGNQIIDPRKMDNVKVEAGTGYFKTSWSGGDIKPEMGNVTVTKTDDGVAWGALYWQYFEQLDKITTAKTPLELKKKLFVERNTASGPVIEPVSEKSILKVGDKVKVRIELRVDRDMEYVHMKDMRASSFEPTNVISSYKWQGGLGYYESTRDAATNFFISYLRKGTYVFEYTVFVTHKGDFSNGITTIQCMYAPEFTSHSEGIRVQVK